MLEKIEMRCSFSCFGGHALHAALVFTIFTTVFILFDPVSVVNTNEDGSASVHYPEVDSEKWRSYTRFAAAFYQTQHSQ